MEGKLGCMKSNIWGIGCVISGVQMTKGVLSSTLTN